jgi:pimeloyl-ACP methyl ester carboxylesterase
VTATVASRRFRHLAYLEAGSPSAPALFLLHGGTMTADWNWSDALPTFTEHYRVIAPDSPGHGRSENPRPRLRYGDIAEDLVMLAVELGLGDAAFYGFSDGAQIALEVGMREPGLPRALVLSAVMHKLTDSYYRGMREFAGSDGFTASAWRTRHPEMAADLSAHHADWEKLAPQIWELWTDPFELPAERLRRISAPTLLLSGDRDRFVAIEQTIELFRLLPTAELAVIPGAGHDYDRRFTQAALDFLAAHDSGCR